MEAASEMVVLRADATTGGSDDVKAAVERLQVSGFPTVVFVDCQGNEHKDLRVLGYVRPDEFRKRLERISAACSG
jgi:thiol:disulfide interchange protein